MHVGVEFYYLIAMESFKLFLLQNFMSIDGTTLIFIFWFPQLSAGPQKPQTLTASKTKYEKFRPKF